MAPQNEQEQPLPRPVPLRRMGTYTRPHQDLLDRTLVQHGLTQHDGDSGVSRLDVCGFQSSI